MPRRPFGNINMQGKKEIRLSCGCCDAIDHREKILKNIAEKEIDEWIGDRVVDGATLER